MAKSIRAGCLIAALTLGLLGATTALADDTRHHEGVDDVDLGSQAKTPDRLGEPVEAQVPTVDTLDDHAGDRQGKPKRGRRHRLLGTNARNRAAKDHPGDRQDTGDDSHFVSIFAYAPGGTYVVRSVPDAASSFGALTYGGLGGKSGFAAGGSGGGGSAGGSSAGGFSAGGFSAGGSSNSGDAPSPEVGTLLGCFILAGTLAYVRRRRRDGTVTEAAATSN